LLQNTAYLTAKETLIQAERSLAYAIRTFERYKQTFALNIVTGYFSLLQQRAVVRNDYKVYRFMVLARERAEALGVDRLAAYQVDQARQTELTYKSQYISDVQTYENSLDNFKVTLGLPVGTELVLDDSSLEELRKMGLPMVTLTADQGHRVAVQHRLDVLNTIDQFEDSKRKIVVAADAFKPSLNIGGGVQLPQSNGYDYSRFDASQYEAYGEVTLSLPLDVLTQRNTWRANIISFEVALRALALSLDNVRNSVQQDLRGLDVARENYDIQLAAVRLADSTVNGDILLLQAGRLDMINLLQATAAWLAALNAFDQSLVSYHTTRWTLLSDLGVIRVDLDRFWAVEQPIPQAGAPGAPVVGVKAAPQTPQKELIPPDKLFQ
jgi:outer membrane protein TolC